MISAIFSSVTSVVTAFSTALGGALTAVVGYFYDAQEGLTDLGGLLTIAIGCGLIYFAFRLIKSLIKHRGA